jgi:predicted HicB family RNase H-like nuclease
MSDKKTGPGKGPTNLSGARGASPVLRVRVPPALRERAEEMAATAGLSVADWVRGLIERARK